MIRYSRRSRGFAICLSALAGYVDAMGFLKVGGFFISFMSGNSTRLAVGLGTDLSAAAWPAALIATFVAGVILGTIVGHRRKHRATVILVLVTLLLALAAVVNELTGSTLAVIPLALAMGAENTIFERDGEVSIAVTYMTGTLVKLGQRLGQAVLGGDRLAWVSYLLLWAGLVAGATVGALLYRAIGLDGLWFAAVVALILAGLAPRIVQPSA